MLCHQVLCSLLQLATPLATGGLCREIQFMFSILDFSFDRESRLGAWVGVSCGEANRGGFGGGGAWLGLGEVWDLHVPD